METHAVSRLQWAAAAVAAACLLGLSALLAAGQPLGPPLVGSEAELESALGGASLSFEPNAGRADDRVDFLARSVAGGSLYLTSGEAVLTLPQGRRGSRELRLGFPGADPGTKAVGLAELPGRANVFIGDDRSRWRTGIPTYSQVRYRGLYPGIDLDFHGDQRELEYDFRLGPHADPSAVAVELGGADSVRLAPSGDLLIRIGDTTVRQRAPVAYQWLGGERRRVRAAYELHGSRVGFLLGDYDRSRPLVIDPLLLAYATYLGGALADNGHEIAVDAAGAAYVAGATSSTDFPLQDPRQSDQGLGDAFVTKFNPDSGGQVTVAYSTYLGGGASDGVSGIAVDAAGGVYVAGPTESTDFPTQDPYQTDQGDFDAFAAKLNPDSGGAVTLAYSTYLGGSLFDVGTSIAVDPAGAAYITGNTFSAGFPVQDDIFPDQALGDAFVTRLNPDSGGAVTLAYSTYLGASNNEEGSAIAVDPAGGAYVTGRTDSTNFFTVDPFQADQGGTDAFVVKIDPDPGGEPTLAYSSYLGGGGLDIGQGIAVDAAGAAYLTGQTESTNFPLQNAIQPDQGGTDAFVTKVDADSGGAVTLAYSTYLGGGAADEFTTIDVDPAGAAYVTGRTDSTNFPLQDAIQPDQGGTDAFVTQIGRDPGGTPPLAFSTYLGGGLADWGLGIAVDSGGAVLVSGYSESANFPTQDPFQPDQGGADAFVARLAPPDTDPPETTITKGPKRKTEKRGAKFRFTSDESGSSFECKRGKQAFKPCTSPRRYKRLKPGKHSFRVRATDRAGNTDTTPAKRKWRVKPSQ